MKEKSLTPHRFDQYGSISAHSVSILTIFTAEFPLFLLKSTETDDVHLYIPTLRALSFHIFIYHCWLLCLPCRSETALSSSSLRLFGKADSYDRFSARPTFLSLIYWLVTVPLRSRPIVHNYMSFCAN